MLNRILCAVFGHKWERDIKFYLTYRACKRCGEKGIEIDRLWQKAYLDDYASPEMMLDVLLSGVKDRLFERIEGGSGERIEERIEEGSEDNGQHCRIHAGSC
jgi:hypothetical protein